MTEANTLRSRTGVMMRADYEEVLRFWFPEEPHLDHAAMVRRLDWWFGGGTDAFIAERFPLLLEKAAHGRLDHWARNARSRNSLGVAPHLIVAGQRTQGIDGRGAIGAGGAPP